MNKAWRRLVRFILLLPLILVGLVLVFAVFPLTGDGLRSRIKSSWSRALLRLCGIDVVPSGMPIAEGSVLYVSNHVSWIDIFVMNSVRATAFVAKSEIRKWPVLGALVAGAGTVFIQRGQRQAVAAVSAAMRLRFERGEAVGLFPEGTTSEGSDLLPFHAGLFETVRITGVRLQPVALRYFYEGRRSAFGAFIGEETMLDNFWRIAGGAGLRVEVIYLPPIETSGPDGTVASRAQLSSEAHAAIGSALIDG